MADMVGNYHVGWYSTDPRGTTPEMDRIMRTAFQDIPESQVHLAENAEAVLQFCKQNLKGASQCYGFVEWHNIDAEQQIYNYTLRGNSGIMFINVEDHTSAVDHWVLPMQWAIDSAITNMTTTPLSMGYTSETQKENEDAVNRVFTKTTINWISPALFLCMIGVVYHLTGALAHEREIGMSALLSCMGVSRLVRFSAFFLAFSSVYLLGWILLPVCFNQVVYEDISLGILIGFHILSGLSLVSYSLFMGSFFSKSHISGIVSSGITVVLAIFVTVQTQVASDPAYQLGAIYVLSFLFPSCNYSYFLSTISRFQQVPVAGNMVNAAPDSDIRLVIFFVAAIIQIFAYFGLALFVEHYIHGSSRPPHTSTGYIESENAVTLSNVVKRYNVNRWWSRDKKPDVVAVNKLTLNMAKGEIMCLLGANGSGKTTTLEMISGLQRATSGQISLGPGGKLGICPQKNVLWDLLTVTENINIWAALKGVPKEERQAAVDELINHCDLVPKAKDASGSLSGGQKRKLQLAIMFVGGSNVCCVDEVSSGLDPLSRRKIWDIILAKRGAVSVLLTTHFLDEADLLSDKVAILSKGVLKALGTTVHLKENMGGGYRIYLASHGTGNEQMVEVQSAKEVLDIITNLEAEGQKYRVAGPELEDVFLAVAQEDHFRSAEIGDHDLDHHSSFDIDEDEDSLMANPNGETARRVSQHLAVESHPEFAGIFKQMITMFKKRCLVFMRNPLADLAAFAIPIIVVGCVRLFITDFDGIGCTPASSLDDQQYSRFNTSAISIGAGPRSMYNYVTPGFESIIFGITSRSPMLTVVQVAKYLTERTRVADNYRQFVDYFNQNYVALDPGGYFLDPPTLAYRLDTATYGAYEGTAMMNYLNNLRMNGTVTLVTDYSMFQDPWNGRTQDTFQFVGYFGLSMAVAPAFYALYPTFERLSKVRAMHYSNGLKMLPLWLAHTLFNFIPWIVVSAICTALIGTATPNLHGVGYMFIVFVLYGLGAILFAYAVSLFVVSQLAAFAVTAVVQAVLFLLYLLAYLCVEAYGSASEIPRQITIVHFTLSLLGPMGSLSRVLFLVLNLFGVTCKDMGASLSPMGDIMAYGGPICYLCIQIVFLFLFILYWESGMFRPNLGKYIKLRQGQHDGADEFLEKADPPVEVVEEVQRVHNYPTLFSDGLRLEHVTKVYGKNRVANDVTFGVERNECFALLGPNGAGKTTTFNMIRGEVMATEGDIYVNDISVHKHPTLARTRLGVCPQFDAMDMMKVKEILRFYAQIRGLRNVDRHVSKVISAVGMDRFRDRMAHKLSGGNKRKLSLAIALIGDPAVLLLDEPSSGMDAFAKRIMWKTLSRVAYGRSIVLTTHSMEEADALANRAGILSKRLLTVGSTELLRDLHGKAYHVHIVCKTAPYTCEEEMTKIVEWVKSKLPGSYLADRLYQGQIKISVPVEGRIKVSDIFKIFEFYKDQLNIESYSVASTTLEEVFLKIVRDNNVAEEGYHSPLMIQHQKPH